MLVSHRPPTFQQSLSTDVLPDYKLHNFTSYKFRKSKSLDNFNSHSKSHVNKTEHNASLSKRSCLVNRASEENQNDTAAMKSKKKVVFADDKGMALNHIRIISEPTNVPPVWSWQFLEKITNRTNADADTLKENWQIKFLQPAADYINFRTKLENQNVSLENVIIKENKMFGTVKVSNISFKKEVLVRLSMDDWKTFTDITCTYVNNRNLNNIHAKVLYDTFSFDVNLEENTQKFEFCICYKSNDLEYWDSNDGKNYTISKKVPIIDSLNNQIDQRNNEMCPFITDIFHAKLDTWTEFASWTHLDNTSPYW